MKNRIRQRALINAVQLLEPRWLLSYSVSSDSAVIMNTSLGEVAIELGTSYAPITTANFLSYVTAGSYNNTVFHRIAVDGETTFEDNTETYSIVQGGGFTNDNGTFTPITTQAPIVNESSQPNVAGTIAMARTSEPNSATSQFFFNAIDNSSVFPDDPTDGYAVFGNVIRGLGIVDTIDNLTPDNNITDQTNVPETNTGGFVTINTATEEDTMTVTIGKDDAAGDHSVAFHDPTTGAGTNISLAGADATLTLTGTNLSATRSDGVLNVTGTNLELQEISSTDTTAKTNLVFSSPGRNKHVNVGDIDITGSLNSIQGKGINLTGDIAVTGSINKIDLLASNAAGYISVDTDQVANAADTFINVPFLSDITIQSGGSIKELITRQYEVDDGTNREFTASGNISKVKIYGAMDATTESGGAVGNFQAAELGAFVEGSTIGSVTVDGIQDGGVYSGAAYNAKTLGIKNVKVVGSVSDSQIISAGNIGTVKAASMASSVIAAGYDSGTSSDGLTALDGFENVLDSNATLKSVSLKTPKGAKATSFSDSQIQAGEIDSLHLGRVATTIASGATYMVAGIQTNDLKSLVATTDQKQSLDLSNVTNQATLNTLLSKRGLNLNSGTSIGTLAASSGTSTGLVSGISYSSLTLGAAVGTSLPAGTVVTIVSGSNSQAVTLSADAADDATTLSVTPFTANAAYPTGSTIDGTTTSVTDLTSGDTYSSITLNSSLDTALSTGTTLTLISSGAPSDTQTITLSEDAGIGDASLSVTPFTANADYASGSEVEGTSVSGTTSGLTSGDTYTAITLADALVTALPSGSVVTIEGGANGLTQSVTLTGAAAGTASLMVAPFVANDTYTSGATIEGTDATTTTPGLVEGDTYTILTLSDTVATALTANSIITLNYDGSTQTATLATDAKVGDTSLSVYAFQAQAAYPSGTAIEASDGSSVGTLDDGTGTTTGTLDSGTTSSPGTLSGAITTNTLASAATSAGALSPGISYTTLTLNAALTAAVPEGTAITLTYGNNTQILTLSSAASSGDTSLSVNSFTPNTTYPLGATLTPSGFIFSIGSIVQTPTATSS